MDATRINTIDVRMVFHSHSHHWSRTTWTHHRWSLSITAGVSDRLLWIAAIHLWIVELNRLPKCWWNEISASALTIGCICICCPYPFWGAWYGYSKRKYVGHRRHRYSTMSTCDGIAIVGLMWCCCWIRITRLLIRTHCLHKWNLTENTRKRDE